MKKILVFTALFFLTVSCFAFSQKKKREAKKDLIAIIETSEGTIKIKLYEKKAPKTVGNFVDLAEGKKEWTDPLSKEKTKKKFYDGGVFHRVIPNFMIQGGCPLGNGMGGPGYTFEDEFVDNLNFDRPGLLAMANAGPDTNGSQFFITTAKTEWLNQKHTIFGEVIDGYEVVEKISQVKRDPNNKPLTPVVIKSVTIQKMKSKK